MVKLERIKLLIVINTCSLSIKAKQNYSVPFRTGSHHSIISPLSIILQAILSITFIHNRHFEIALSQSKSSLIIKQLTWILKKGRFPSKYIVPLHSLRKHFHKKKAMVSSRFEIKVKSRGNQVSPWQHRIRTENRKCFPLAVYFFLPLGASCLPTKAVNTQYYNMDETYRYTK